MCVLGVFGGVVEKQEDNPAKKEESDDPMEGRPKQEAPPPRKMTVKERNAAAKRGEYVPPLEQPK